MPVYHNCSTAQEALLGKLKKKIQHLMLASC